MAIGNPVAFDASADERDTRGFISMTTCRPVAGSTANCTLEPPVSTPTRRMQAKAASRICWYSTSVSVCAGATVIESPVCTPIGSTFSIEQMITQLSARSRITSSSNSFQPAIDSSTRISPIGLAAMPADGEALELLGRRGDAGAPAAEDVGRADDDRQADLVDDRAGLVERVGGARARHVEADLDHRLLEPLAVLGGGDRLGVGADHLRRAGHADQPALVQLHRHVQPGLAAERRQHGVGPLALDDRRQHLRRQRLDVGAVGEVRVGHDRRRVRVGEDDAVALFAQHAAGLGAGVVELARLADDDRAGADDQDRVECRCAWASASAVQLLYGDIISANRSNR